MVQSTYQLIFCSCFGEHPSDSIEFGQVSNGRVDLPNQPLVLNHSINRRFEFTHDLLHFHLPFPILDLLGLAPLRQIRGPVGVSDPGPPSLARVAGDDAIVPHHAHGRRRVLLPLPVALLARITTSGRVS